MAFSPFFTQGEKGKRKPTSGSSRLQSGSAHIPHVFFTRIAIHLTKNVAQSIPGPLILAVQGAPGEGKTFQVEEVIVRLGGRPFMVSGASLAGSHEGEAINAIRDAYLSASEFVTENDRPAAVLVDDFDLSVASVIGGRDYTVNSQLLAGFLMNLCDNPTYCAGVDTLRVPIFVTGNNFTNLYVPLKRQGRMDFFTWRPDRSDKLAIIGSMFSGIVDDPKDVVSRELLENFPGQPISFFSSLRTDAWDRSIQRRLNSGREIRPSQLALEIGSAAKLTLVELIGLGRLRAMMGARDELSVVQDEN